MQGPLGILVLKPSEATCATDEAESSWVSLKFAAACFRFLIQLEAMNLKFTSLRYSHPVLKACLRVDKRNSARSKLTCLGRRVQAAHAMIGAARAPDAPPSRTSDSRPRAMALQVTRGPGRQPGTE